MRVFISWSGELSRLLADSFRRWLPGVLQAVKPYFSPSDIEKGSRWDTEISEQLKSTDVCIIALTKENLKSPWIMFEAGAISRTVDKARICPIVFDLRPTDVQGPLARFQATNFEKSEIRQLLGTINDSAGDSGLDEKVLDDVFHMWWPRLHVEVEEILKQAPHLQKEPVIREDRELIEETLQIVRGLQDALADSDQYLGQTNALRTRNRLIRPPRPYVRLGIAFKEPANSADFDTHKQTIIECVDGLVGGRLQVLANNYRSLILRVPEAILPQINSYLETRDSVESVDVLRQQTPAAD